MPGRKFLQIPGPTNLPERVVRAMERPMINHRGREMVPLLAEIVERLRRVFGTERARIAIFPGSGAGAMEAAVVNSVGPGERVLAFSSGYFGDLFADILRDFGADVELVRLELGDAVTPELVASRLAADREHRVKAVTLVHNETSTGVSCDVGAIAREVRRSGHPALILVDCVSSLGSLEFRFDEWDVDVAVAGSQKGLMLPPGLAVACVSERARQAGERVTTPRHHYDWRPVFETLDSDGFLPTTPPTSLLFGLREALAMLVDEEGLDGVYARHRRLGEAVRQGVSALDLGIVCRDPARASDTVTAVLTPPGVDAGELIRIGLDRLEIEFGAGIAELHGKAFRIGHMGSLNELEVLATLAGAELALNLAGADVRLGAGVGAAQAYLAGRLRERVPG
jgi:alanine-glyoxylate transaminase/serine-glyoxylate transaminase/serine-pyruvate transaminase